MKNLCITILYHQEIIDNNIGNNNNGSQNGNNTGVHSGFENIVSELSKCLRCTGL